MLEGVAVLFSFFNFASFPGKSWFLFYAKLMQIPDVYIEREVKVQQHSGHEVVYCLALFSFLTQM